MYARNRLTPNLFFCKDCISKDEKVTVERQTINFSEAKEEETECYYCSKTNYKHADTLHGGYPSCRECKRTVQINVIPAKLQNSDKQLIIKQIMSKGEREKSMERSPPPQFGNKSEKPNVAMASLDLTNLIKNRGSETFRKKPDIATSQNFDPQFVQRVNNQLQPIDFSIPPSTQASTARGHFRGNTMGGGGMGGFDFMKVLSSQDLKDFVHPRVSDPKIVEFFQKVNQKGITVHKSNLYYSTSQSSPSGKKFHEKCDKKTPLILLITMSSGYMIGAFFYKPMDPKSIETVDTLCGLFSTTDGKAIDFYGVRQNKILYSPSGITFGSPQMLTINFDSPILMTCNFELGFYDPFGVKHPFKFESNEEMAKLITDISVYKLK